MTFRKKIYGTSFIAILIFVGLIFKENTLSKNMVRESYPPTGPTVSQISAENVVSSQPLLKLPGGNKITKSEVDETKINLDKSNFESSVGKCFQGEKCELIEDPKTLYMHFRKLDNNIANDNLVAFLRSKLKDPAYRDRYKDILKQMIDDLYSYEEKQFQEAAYYNYLGNLQKSLDIYLDLEHRIENGEILSHAPKLNIANTLYDMKRYRDSLPYYQAALNEYTSHRQQVSVPSQNEMINFIEDRIHAIEKL